MIRFIRFAAVGVVNTGFSYVIFATLVFLDVNYLAAATVSYISGTILSYFLNARHTFKTQVQLNDYIKFFIINIFSYSLGIAMLYTLKEHYDANVYLAQLAVVFFRLPFTFLLSKAFVFAKQN